MDAHDSRAYLFAQAELVRAMGMQIDSQVALLRLTSTTPIANDAVLSPETISTAKPSTSKTWHGR